MLVAVIMIFVVLSFTGVAVLDVSYNSRASSLSTIENIKVQYMIESSVNETLWMINTGVDSLVNTDADGITTTYNADTQVLTVSLDTLNTEAVITMDLSEDTHFNRGIASSEPTPADIASAGLTEDNKGRKFNFLPNVDMDYFTDNAVTIHTESFKSWDNETFADGIHIFTGSMIEMEDITLNAGTMVFTGRYIFFSGENNIVAPEPDSLGADPVLIFTHPSQNFSLNSSGGGETILGTIYAKNKISLTSGTCSGPIIAKEVILDDAHAYNFEDDTYGKYYTWTKGFGHKADYDWPKQLGRWTTSKWEKKSRS
jgi:hypothetical protein